MSMKKYIQATSAGLGGKFRKALASKAISVSGGVNNEAPATILNQIGNAWRCWRLQSEPDRVFAFRLALHLQTLAIAIEEDLERVLQAERAVTQRSEEDGSINDR